MDETLISIIVPIYNVEKYIRKCVESLRNQDYKNIEIILIDDGSLDNSGKIIDELSRLDNRILTRHTKNQGVSVARNLGLELARGEYVMFVDGDDWVDADYVSYFYNIVRKKDCFLAMNVNNYSIDGQKSNSKDYIITSEKAIEWIYLGRIFVAVWNKIYKTDFLKKYQIKFDSSIWYGEGMLFNIECLQFTEKVAIGEKSVYHQVFNSESAMRAFSLKNQMCGIKSMKMQKKIWTRYTKEIADAWKYHLYCFNWTIIMGLVRSDQTTDYNKEYKECIQSLRRDILIPIRTEKSIKQKINWICISFFPRIMAQRQAKKYYLNWEKMNQLMDKTEL